METNHTQSLKIPVQVADLNSLKDRTPSYAKVENTDLVLIRFDEQISVLYGRCLHRGALLSDGHVDERDNLICGLHQWDYRIDTGISEYNNNECLKKFKSLIEDGKVYIDRAEVIAYEELHPQPFKRDEYLGTYQDTHPEDTEPYTLYIKELAQNGLKKVGHHGPSSHSE